MNFATRLNRKGDKLYYQYDNGREAGQRGSTGMFTYTNPKTPAEKNHNKETLDIIKVKESQAIIDRQAIGTAYIPNHKFKANFLDFYKDFVKVKSKASEGNRHWTNSLTQFKAFIEKDFISPIDITPALCEDFRRYLLVKYNGETPANYYSRFKSTLEQATTDRYFLSNPSEDLNAMANAVLHLKQNLEADEYIKLLNTPCRNRHVKDAFVFSLYTGLRWVDIEALEWSDLKENMLTTRIIQRKTGMPVILTLHPIAEAVLERLRREVSAFRVLEGKVFTLPTRNGANDVLEEWVKDAGIEKHITWSCARLSFSILLQDRNVDDATVAYLLGHTTTRHVNSTYKRHRPKSQIQAISQLPMPETMQAVYDRIAAS